MSENATKAVAFRIPISDYIRFIQDAKNSNMVFSDWLLLKIYAEDKSEKLVKTNDDLNQSITGYVNTIESFNDELKKKDDVILELENNNNYLKHETKLLQDECSRYKEEYEKCNQELTEAKNSFTGENVLKFHQGVKEYQDLIMHLLELWEKQDYNKIGEYLKESSGKNDL